MDVKSDVKTEVKEEPKTEVKEEVKVEAKEEEPKTEVKAAKVAKVEVKADGKVDAGRVKMENEERKAAQPREEWLERPEARVSRWHAARRLPCRLSRALPHDGARRRWHRHGAHQQ